MVITHAEHDVFPAGIVGSFSTDDVSEIAKVTPGWDQQFEQLGRGRFNCKMFMAHTARMGVGTFTWSPGVMIRGRLPVGSAAIAIPLSHDGPISHRGMELVDGTAPALYHGEEIDFRAAWPGEFFMLAVERRKLDEHSRVILGRELCDVRRRHHVLIRDPKATRRQLIDLMNDLERTLPRDPARLTRPASARALETRVLDAVLGSLEAPAASAVDAEMSASMRREQAWEAERYLRAHLHEPITLFELCRAINAAQRTLHLAFHEEFGTTPKAYLKMLRLNAARRDLQHAQRGATVTDIAVRWNFLHFGWFSHDYLAMFGESPSMTLRKSRESARSPRLAVSG